MIELIIIAGVILAALVFIGILTNDAKNNPVKFYKNGFFMLKDKINNIYVYIYEYKKNDIESYNYLYKNYSNNKGRIYINNNNEFIINEANVKSEKIEVYNYYDRYNNNLIRTFAEIKFKTKLDDTSESKIEYIIEFDPYTNVIDSTADKLKNTFRETVKIEGVFEIIRKPEAEVISLYNSEISPLKKAEERFVYNVFNFNYFFINGKEKINSFINGAEEFSDEFVKEKIEENNSIIGSYVKEYNKKDWQSLFDDSILSYIGDYNNIYDELKEFKSFNILYYDDKTICIYKRFSKLEDIKLVEINNLFAIFELDSQILISSYLRDLVKDPEELLKKHNVNSDFYSNIDNLVFGITDSFIVIMKEKGYGKIFIDNKNIKDYIKKDHYLAYLFN
ncbi:hypothetical protein [Brachyspira hampsonii]|uniref:Ankyrin n=1 Tax=Brachyspira hampsonii 30446 TaxID=1289135 RepID=A0A2U4F2L8_9SPIR|nr:hypothetical protein [Brachyspira hampsonii]EKV57589.1 hypothetical protein A966_04346 [Brachyspira hampsonii 30446]MBW5390939.1 hypothetical protein [Brachyspira hampsonii]MBW5393899.1 hypothetical protein [Brachyspira hampsonii]OEJ20648.1 hypothetical protein A9495_10960 [Brachyspira hampsonii]